MSKVFISYAREDEAVAERLYKDLKNAGADPWLDKHDLFPGEGWRGAIKQALRRSSHFLYLISRNSVRKRGYALRMEYCPQVRLAEPIAMTIGRTSTQLIETIICVTLYFSAVGPVLF